MRVIMPVIIDRAGRNFNADETDGVSGRDNDGALLGRAGYPREISAMVVFLCSPPASYITGQTVCVNGGNYLH